MTPFVLDNSVTMRWCFENTSNAYAEAILHELAAGGEATVPIIWAYEVISVLAKGQRIGTITPQKAAEFLEDLKAFNIGIDREGLSHILTDVHQLAVSHRLTGYDAAYLELAIRKQLPLATLDEELIRSCKDAGISRFDPPVTSVR